MDHNKRVSSDPKILQQLFHVSQLCCLCCTSLLPAKHQTLHFRTSVYESTSERVCMRIENSALLHIAMHLGCLRRSVIITFTHDMPADRTLMGQGS